MVTNRGAMLIVLSLTGLFTTLVVAELASHEHFHSFEHGPDGLQFESFEELLRHVPPVPKVPIEKRNEVKNARKKPAKAKQPPPSITGGFTSGFVLPRQPISLVDASSDGICYIKVPKTASTTVAGVVRRIAARLNFAAYNPEGRHYTFDAGPWCKAQRTKDPNIKIVTANLGMPQENWLPACFRKPILLGSVRHPLQREISYFNFLYTTTGKPMEGRMEQFYEWVQSSGMKRLPAQTKYLNGKAFFAKSSQTESLNAYGRCPSNDPTQCSYVRAVFNAYDFLFVADQMVDSLIVFKRLFNVTWSDLLHIPGKVRGSQCVAASHRIMHLPVTRFIIMKIDGPMLMKPGCKLSH